MSIVGTERIRATRRLVCVTRASRALTGSLRTDRGLRPRASYVRQSPVRPSQQPTLKRHRGHWNVPWRHSIAAAQRGQGSSAGAGVVSAGGDEAAIRRRYGARRTAFEESVGAPYPLGTPICTGRPPLRAARLSALPSHARESRNAALVPGADRANRGAPRVSPFPYRSRGCRADPREGRASGRSPRCDRRDRGSWRCGGPRDDPSARSAVRLPGAPARQPSRPRHRRRA